ncbi:MAG: glucose-6-phosphate isomerase [Anaerolineae bacterium]|nr:glucose-6-phosphate isomerase [Anaerolineae bacterium]MDW8070551.1 glucose-6-phosphate isomerase [Anaerolineae bacterium]
MYRFDIERLDRQFPALRLGETLAAMAAQNIIPRIWSRDHTVWKSEDREISNRLGWLHSPDDMPPHVEALHRFTRQLCAEGIRDGVLLGMGGSSLAPEMFRKVFGVRPGFPELRVLDSTDPGAVLEVEQAVDLEHTLFIVSTKSGSTVETLSAFKYFYNRLAATRRNSTTLGHHFIAITDPGSPLAELAARYQFRATFLNNPDIGGRYSALSYFGLVPAALIGLDIAQLLTRGQEMATACGAPVPPAENPGAQLGAIIGRAALTGRDKLTFVISPSLASFGDWAEQLLAESTGKEGKGILPVVGEPLGDADLYAYNDRLFVQLALADEPAEDAALAQLERAGQPVVRIALRDRYDVGAQCFLWEMATAVAGHLLGVNPFDQPNVEAAKALARQVVAEYATRGSIPSESPLLVEDGVALHASDAQLIGAATRLADALGTFLAQARPGDYIALQAYLQPTPATHAQLQALRLKLRDRLRLATTLGYGPRFLHSTGQLHKGDAGKGLFIQLTAEGVPDLPIPDEAGQPEASLRFGVLKMAQALGDYQALRAVGRRVIRLHLQDIAAGLEHLARCL